MQFTQHITPTTWDYWRAVLTLASKDIIDALKNKTTLTMIVGLSLLMLTVEALPLLLKLDDRPRVAIYDAARSATADELRREGTMQIYELRTAGDALNAAREASSPLLALVLPPGWQSETGALTIDGYVAHGVRPQTVQRLQEQTQQALSASSGRPITIRVQTVYPTLENGGHTVMVALGLVLAITMITSILVPYLILEEKTSHTLEALRASPLSITQVLLGKGLAGMVYGLLAAAVLLAFNLSRVNLWALILPTVLALVLFGVGLGLLVGIVVENEGSVQMWASLLTIFLLAPLLLTYFASSRLPQGVQQLMAWLPTTAAFDLVRLSFGNVSPASFVGARMVAILIAAILVFIVAVWRLRAWES